MKNNIMMKESSVVLDVQNIIYLYGLYCWRNNTGAQQTTGGRFIRFGKRGSADFIGVCPDGRFLAIECKRPSGGRISDWQKEFLGEVNRRGGVAIVVRSGTECLELLRERGVIVS